jgi:hypothetical protein
VHDSLDGSVAFGRRNQCPFVEAETPENESGEDRPVNMHRSTPHSALCVTDHQLGKVVKVVQGL